MKDKKEPYRHEIRSKLKTQVVKDRRRREQEKYIMEMMREAEDLGLYDLGD
tara:strand:- start:202 stop:354 length:153 start_codon:yes stop_codon:yes gene_type:complete